MGLCQDQEDNRDCPGPHCLPVPASPSGTWPTLGAECVPKSWTITPAPRLLLGGNSPGTPPWGPSTMGGQGTAGGTRSCGEKDLRQWGKYAAPGWGQGSTHPCSHCPLQQLLLHLSPTGQGVSVSMSVSMSVSASVSVCVHSLLPQTPSRLPVRNPTCLINNGSRSQAPDPGISLSLPRASWAQQPSWTCCSHGAVPGEGRGDGVKCGSRAVPFILGSSGEAGSKLGVLGGC